MGKIVKAEGAISAPVTLAPGSFDVETLQAGLDKAAGGSEANFAAAVDKAIGAARESDGDVKPVDPRDIPGHKFVEVENSLGGKETIQVYDPKQEAAAVEAGVGQVKLPGQGEAETDGSAAAQKKD